MQRISRSVLLGIVIIVVLAFFWRKIQIVFFVPMSLGQLILLIGVVILLLFLTLDHFINRTRP